MEKVEILKSSVEELRQFFLAQLTLLKGLCNENLDGRAAKVRIVIASACSTGTAIHLLGKNLEYFYTEMTMLARAFIEKLTNFCYLQVCEETEYERFLLYPLYRAFHSSDKSKYTPKGKIGIQYSGKNEMKKEPQVVKALRLFSDTNPRMNWSNLNIDQKIAVLSQETKIRTEFFLMNTLTIYSNASEALHGSLYGCALATGAYTPGINHKKHEEVSKNLFKNTALLYVQLSSIIHETINLLSANNNKSSVETSIKNEEHVLAILKIIFERNGAKT